MEKLPVHRPRRLPADADEQWRAQIGVYRRSLELFHRAVESRSHLGRRPWSEPRRPAVEPARGADAPAGQSPALAGLPEPSIGPAPVVDWGPLTRREREVAALVARGLSNRAIAGELVLTEGTAANHVRRILLRLHFDSRAQIAAWVAGDAQRRAYAPERVPPFSAPGRSDRISSSVAL